jgi:hypothetical protein
MPQIQQQNQAQAVSGKARFDQNIEAIKAGCNSPEFQLYYNKTSCSANDITLSQMTDKSKITTAEKSVLEAATINVDNLLKDNLNLSRQLGSQKDKAYADYVETVQNPSLEKNRLDLFDGKITWGDFNRRRKEIADTSAATRKRIFGN